MENNNENDRGKQGIDRQKVRVHQLRHNGYGSNRGHNRYEIYGGGKSALRRAPALGNEVLHSGWAHGDKDDESGSLKYLHLLPEPVRPDYETLIVTFAEPIRTLERRIFDDPQAWGVSTLKEWIDGYESTRFTQISDRTAVVTSEYNMMSVREWLARHTEIETCKTA